MEEKITVDPKDAQDNKIMGILAYLGILVLVPIFAAKDSPFARYHANQGLVLIIVIIALSIVLAILTPIFAFVSLALVVLTGLLNAVVGIGALVFVIIGIINAAKGEMKPLPLIGKFTILK